MKCQIKKELNKLKIAGQTGGDVEAVLKEKLNKILNEIGEEIESERKEKIRKIMLRIVEKQTTATNEIWRVRSNVIKRSDAKMAVEDEEGTLITNKEDILLRHNEYYRSLLQTRKPESEAEQLNEEIENNFKLNMENKLYDSQQINAKFTMEELENVLKNLQTRKCPGRDEITNEILKSSWKKLKISLLKMINWFWTEEQLPDELTKIHIKSIYKGKGKTSSLSNHRGIFLGSEIIKLYEKLIYKRCAPKIDEELSEFQAGGRPKRNIADHIFILRSIMQHLKYLNIDLLIEFLDLIKAFDKMSLKHVLNDLWRCNVRGKIWRTIYNINKKSNISIKTSMGDTPDFNIGESLKQGSVLASSLAAMHTDRLSQLFNNEGLGVMYGNIRINCLLFQDDVLKLETSAHNLNKANEMITQYQKMNLMEFHQDKSKFMTTAKEADSIKLGNINLGITDSYLYLGDYISTNGTLKDTIESRNRSCTSTVAELNSIIEETVDENILIDAIITYHNSIIIPKLCLNSETWTLNSSELLSISIIQNKAIKRVLRLPQGTPSHGLRAELGIYSVGKIMIKRKLMFLHRLLNQQDGNITRRVLLEQENLPGETWLSNTLNVCRKLGLSDNLDSIAHTPKSKWKQVSNNAIKQDEEEQLKMWAGKSKKYTCKTLTVSPKNYINYLPPALAMTILKARTGMTEIKTNYKNMYSDQLCRKCLAETEDLCHILNCKNEHNKEEKQLINDAVNILDNVEVESPSRVKYLATLIHREVQRLKEIPVLKIRLESAPTLASSEEEDMH